MIIKGFQKTTLLDFPGKVACTIFTGGCNFRCPFCHNASLVLQTAMTSNISEDEIFFYLGRRKEILDGVCVTGGEPLLQKDIFIFLEKIKSLGLLVKLDTNGSYPLELQKLIKAGILDYIAMDLKNSRFRYAETCGLTSYPAEIEKSIDIIMNSHIPYEFRTTVVREFHTKEDIRDIAKQIAGAEHYFLQKFMDSGNLIGKNLSAYSFPEMQEMLLEARKYVPEAALRGIDNENA